MSQIKSSRSNEEDKERIQRIIDNHDGAPDNTKIIDETKLKNAIKKLEFKRDNCPTANNS